MTDICNDYNNGYFTTGFESAVHLMKTFFMDINAIREKLHQYIDVADKRKIEAMYVMLENEIESYSYDFEEIELFHNRRNRHLNGETISYTPEESLHLIRSSKK